MDSTDKSAAQKHYRQEVVTSRLAQVDTLEFLKAKKCLGARGLSVLAGMQ